MSVGGKNSTVENAKPEAKPIKDRPVRCGLVHRAVYSIPRRADGTSSRAVVRRETEQTFLSLDLAGPWMPFSDNSFQLRRTSPVW